MSSEDNKNTTNKPPLVRFNYFGTRHNHSHFPFNPYTNLKKEKENLIDVKDVKEEKENSETR